MTSGNAETRISEERTCSATKNEIGSINATCAGPSASLIVVDEGGATRRERRGRESLSALSLTRARGRKKEYIAAARKTSATERQQTHACATWSERSDNNSLNGKERGRRIGKISENI